MVESKSEFYVDQEEALRNFKQNWLASQTNW